MAEGDGAILNSFKEQVMEGTFDLSTGGHAIQVTLHTGYTPDIDAHTVWANVSATEYGTGDGYTAGGKVLTSQDVTQDNTNDRGVFDAADVTWTSLGALTPAAPSHAIMWDNTPTSPADPLIAYWELGSTATNGGDYTLQWHANGILLLT
jgi:hypothetical protein